MAIAKDVEVDPKMGLDLGDIVYDAKFVSGKHGK